MNGRRVGEWRRMQGKRDHLQYDEAWRTDPQARALSLSLPLTASATIASPAVRNYFDNLLPDDPRIRERLQIRFATRSADTFDLLEAVGRDCVGAVQLLPADEAPVGWSTLNVQALKPKDVEAILIAVPTTNAPLLAGATDDEDFRISIAGGQEKTALLRMGRTWYRPRGATPTTHILKLPLGIVGGQQLDLTHSVDNEFLCAQLLSELGLEVAGTQIGRFGTQRVLIVERFDRRWQNIGTTNPLSARFKAPRGSWIARLPQEDFCQATGASYNQKYEAHGGPGITQILGILARSEHAVEDRRTFALVQLGFWMLAAIDGHAKNFSIFHRRGGGYQLTPLYDVLSAWPVIGSRAKNLALKKVKLAMGLRGGGKPHYKLAEIQPRHFKALADSLADPEAWPAMLALVQRVPDAIRHVETRLPQDFAPQIWEAITKGLSQQAQAFLQAAPK
jgi:serine/threonine-protein kinase HipA